MDEANQPLGYYNYEDKTTKTRLPIKNIGTIAAIVLAAVVIVVAAVFVIKSMNTENNENEEPGIAWAGENSPIAGIQFLTRNGLSFEQYTDLYNKLTRYFTEQHPEYKYVEYIDDSFYTSYETDGEAVTDCVDEDAAGYEEDEIGFWNCTDDELATETLGFRLSSDDGQDYKVEIEQNHAASEVDIRLYNPDDQRLI
ncbi:hypothetical protein IKG31_01200 [Candidatus Saccharibacteria bacterium]|nr:hypothetical protein [Candidatus Saccharibacteria bacterium]